MVLYICTQYAGDCCQILAWHRHEVDSSGKLVGSAEQVEGAMKKILVCLIVSESFLTLRVLFEAAFLPFVFSFLLLCMTIAFFFVINATPLISPEKFNLHEEDHSMSEISPEHLSRWWDLYKHPLIAKSVNPPNEHSSGSKCRLA